MLFVVPMGQSIVDNVTVAPSEVGGADGIQGRGSAREPKMRRVVRSLVGSVIEDAETMIDGAHEDSVRRQRFAIYC